LHLDLSRRTHYATIICYAARTNELAVDREAIANYANDWNISRLPGTASKA
jgi:hypothetical protein